MYILIIQYSFIILFFTFLKLHTCKGKTSSISSKVCKVFCKLYSHIQFIFHFHIIIIFIMLTFLTNPIVSFQSPLSISLHILDKIQSHVPILVPFLLYQMLKQCNKILCYLFFYFTLTDILVLFLVLFLPQHLPAFLPYAKSLPVSQ